MKTLELNIDTTEAISALDKLRERIEEDQARLEAMKKAMDELANSDPMRASIESNNKVLASLEERKRLGARDTRRWSVILAVSILALIGHLIVVYLHKVQ